MATLEASDERSYCAWQLNENSEVLQLVTPSASGTDVSLRTDVSHAHPAICFRRDTPAAIKVMQQVTYQQSLF